MLKQTQEKLTNQYSEVLIPNIDFSIEDGWTKIVEDFIKFSYEFIYLKQKNQNFKILSFKQKFGCLEIDYENGNKYADIIRNAAVKLSLSTCEVCGKVGKLSSNDAYLRFPKYKTLCKEHAVSMLYWYI